LVRRFAPRNDSNEWDLLVSRFAPRNDRITFEIGNDSRIRNLTPP